MGVIFRHTVEALVVGVAEKKRALARAELVKLGVHPPRDVSMDVWVPAVHAIAGALFPQLSPEQQLEALGREVVRSFTQGVVGRGLLLVLRLVGRRRALLRMAENFRTADSVMNVTSVEKSPTWIQVHFDAGRGLETHMLGIMREGVALISAQGECSVTGQPDGSGGFTIDVKW